MKEQWKIAQRLHTALHLRQWDDARDVVCEAEGSRDVFLAADSTGHIALYTALGKRAPNHLVLDLIEACEDGVFFVDDLGNSTLHWAARFNAAKEILVAIIKKKPSLLDHENHSGLSARELMERKFDNSTVLSMEKAARQEEDTAEKKKIPEPVNASNKSRLHSELDNRNWDGVREAILEAKGDPGVFLSPNFTGYIPLYIAMGKNAPSCLILDMIEACEESAFFVDNLGNTPAHWSARSSSSLDVIQVLAEKKPSLLHTRNNSGTTPADILKEKHGDQVVLCIEEAATKATASPDSPTNETPKTSSKKLQLHEALYKSQWGEARKVMNEESECAQNMVLQADSMGSTPLYIAMRKNAPTELVLDLIKACEECVLLVDDFGNNVLHWAASFNASPEVVQNLLRKRSSLLDKKNKSGKTPRNLLRGTLDEGSMLLLEKNCENATVVPKLTQKTSNLMRNQRLFEALYKCQWEMAREAMNEVDEVQSLLMSTDSMGNTPLYIAMWKSAPAQFLLDMIHSCEETLFVTDSFGNTAFHWAATFSAPKEVVLLMVQKRPSFVNKANRWGKTPKDLFPKDLGLEELVDLNSTTSTAMQAQLNLGLKQDDGSARVATPSVHLAELAKNILTDVVVKKPLFRKDVSSDGEAGYNTTDASQNEMGTMASHIITLEKALKEKDETVSELKELLQAEQFRRVDQQRAMAHAVEDLKRKSTTLRENVVFSRTSMLQNGLDQPQSDEQNGPDQPQSDEPSVGVKTVQENLAEMRGGADFVVHDLEMQCSSFEAACASITGTLTELKASPASKPGIATFDGNTKSLQGLENNLAKVLDQLAQRDEEIVELKQSLEAGKKDAENMRRVLKERDAEVACLKQKLEAAETNGDKLKNLAVIEPEKQELEKEVENECFDESCAELLLQVQLAEKDREIAALTQNMKEVAENFSEMERVFKAKSTENEEEKDILDSRIAELERKLDESQASRKSLQTRVEETDAKVVALEEARKVAVQSLNQSTASYETKETKYQQDKEELVAEVEEIRVKLEVSERTSSEIRQNLAQKESEMVLFKQALAADEEKIKELTESSTNFDRIQENLLQLVDMLQAQREESDARVSVLRRQLAVMESNANMLKEDNEKVNSDMKKVVKSLESEEVKLNLAVRRAAELEEKCSASSTALQVVSDQLARKDAEVATLRKADHDKAAKFDQRQLQLLQKAKRMEERYIEAESEIFALRVQLSKNNGNKRLPQTDDCPELQQELENIAEKFAEEFVAQPRHRGPPPSA